MSLLLHNSKLLINLFIKLLHNIWQGGTNSKIPLRKNSMQKNQPWFKSNFVEKISLIRHCVNSFMYVNKYYGSLLPERSGNFHSIECKTYSNKKNERAAGYKTMQYCRSMWPRTGPESLILLTGHNNMRWARQGHQQTNPIRTGS